MFQLKVGLYILPFAHLHQFEKVAWLCLANFQASLTLAASSSIFPLTADFLGLSILLLNGVPEKTDEEDYVLFPLQSDYLCRTYKFEEPCKRTSQYFPLYLLIWY